MLRCWDGRDWYIVSLRGDGILESVKGLPAVEYGGSIDLVNPFEELKRYIRTRSGSACHPDGYLVTAARRRGNHSPSCSPGFASVCPKWDNHEHGGEGMPPESAPAKANDSAAPPSFLSIGIRAEKESPPALPTIGRFSGHKSQIPRKPFKVKQTGQSYPSPRLGPRYSQR